MLREALLLNASKMLVKNMLSEQYWAGRPSYNTVG